MTDDAASETEADPGANPDAEADSDAEVDPGTEADSETEPDLADEVRAALAEVRRERRKAALVYASLDSVCVLLAVSLAVEAVGVSNPAVAASAFDALGLPAPGVGALAGLAAGLLAFGAEFAVRTRRSAVERFEAVNPAVEEALRTARDATEADRSNPMVRALYADVLDRLRETSSVGLLNSTRLAATVVVAVALSLLAVQTAVVGVDLVGSGPGAGSAGPAGGTGDRSALPDDETADLRSGDEVLGEPTDVSAGSENLSAAVSAEPGGDGERDWNYDGGDGGSDGEVEARRAGFASPERVEDAALVQRYVRELEGNATAD